MLHSVFILFVILNPKLLYGVLSTDMLSNHIYLGNLNHKDMKPLAYAHCVTPQYLTAPCSRGEPWSVAWSYLTSGRKAWNTVCILQYNMQPQFAYSLTKTTFAGSWLKIKADPSCCNWIFSALSHGRPNKPVWLDQGEQVERLRCPVPILWHKLPWHVDISVWLWGSSHDWIIEKQQLGIVMWTATTTD